MVNGRKQFKMVKTENEIKNKKINFKTKRKIKVKENSWR